MALFINARTDLFLAQGRDAAQSLGEALDRAKAYAAAGASGFFIPGLRDDALIGRVCNGVALPVNVMVIDGAPSNDRLTELGVSRISYGPIPYIRAMGVLQQDARCFPSGKGSDVRGVRSRLLNTEAVRNGAILSIPRPPD